MKVAALGSWRDLRRLRRYWQTARQDLLEAAHWLEQKAFAIPQHAGQQQLQQWCQQRHLAGLRASWRGRSGPVTPPRLAVSWVPGQSSPGACPCRSRPSAGGTGEDPGSAGDWRGA